MQDTEGQGRLTHLLRLSVGFLASSLGNVQPLSDDCTMRVRPHIERRTYESLLGSVQLAIPAAQQAHQRKQLCLEGLLRQSVARLGASAKRVFRRTCAQLMLHQSRQLGK